MKLPSDFQKTLAEKPVKQLYEMLAQADDYLPEALDAAREELERRSLPAERVTAEVQSVMQARVAKEASMTAEPLGWPLRVSILILGAMVGVPVALYYLVKGGCNRKLKESLLWIFYAILFWLGIGVLIGTLSALKIIQ